MHKYIPCATLLLLALSMSGQALNSVVAAPPTVSIKAEKDPAGGSGGTFVLERNSDRGALRVQLSYSGLGISGIDYAQPATIQTIPDGAREIRIPVTRLEGSPVIGRDDVKATLEPGIFYTVREAAASARVWLTPDWPVPPPARPRKIYAHYMACYPVAAAATAHHRANDAHKIRHDGQGQFDAIGDRWRNWPLVPDGMNLSLEESADLEIRRALRAGIDGFAVDAWAGGDNAKEFFSVLLKVARDKDYPFEVTVCLDPGVLGNDGMRETFRWIMQEHGQNPKLARRDGKPLIFGYLSSFIGFHHGAAALKQEPEFADTDHKELIKNRDLRMTKAGWQRMAEGHREIEKAAGTPLFFHYCMSAFFHQVGGTPAEILQAATFMAGQFGAVGEFTGGGPHHDMMAEAVRAAGAEWSEPMFFQYENIGWGGNRISQGTSILRDRWQHARDNDSTLIQFVTWNDYTENTCLAPAYETRYAIFDLNAYFIQWWKTGQPPEPDHDKVYLLYRKYPKGAKIFPFKPKQPDDGGVLEVLTILTKPARVRLPGRHEEWDAPAGLSWKQFPLTPGPVVAELVRHNSFGVPHVELRLESPEPITDRPYREQNGLTCVSSECLRQWKLDFSDAPPVWRGEYADDDRDGLPNWFEMYWYGKFLDYRTCTNADPETVGAGGKTLLQHYLDQTDPAEAQPRTDSTMDEKRRTP